MIKVEDIYNRLDNISPFELQEKWDNSGLIVGSMGRKVTDIVVSLDIDRENLLGAKEKTLFIVHHPLIFSGLKRLDFSKYPSNLLEIIVKKDISVIAMHTNFDKTHLNRFLFEEVLGFEIDSMEDFICTAIGDWRRDELISHLKSKLELDTLRVISPKERIKSISLTTGAGASFIDNVQSDCFLTGDIKYHDAIKALNQNLMMIDIGHYDSERFFVNVMSRELENLGVSAIISQSCNPFKIYTTKSFRPQKDKD